MEATKREKQGKVAERDQPEMTSTQWCCKWRIKCSHWGRQSQVLTRNQVRITNHFNFKVPLCFHPFLQLPWPWNFPLGLLMLHPIQLCPSPRIINLFTTWLLKTENYYDNSNFRPYWWGRTLSLCILDSWRNSTHHLHRPTSVRESSLHMASTWPCQKPSLSEDDEQL